MDVNNNYTVVTGYRIYRTASLNLEDSILVAEITSLDIRGFVDTMFTEEIDGFFKYCVSAFNGSGEGGKSCIAAVAQAQSDRI
jgi:maleate cis-trans isomerase